MYRNVTYNLSEKWFSSKTYCEEFSAQKYPVIKELKICKITHDQTNLKSFQGKENYLFALFLPRQLYVQKNSIKFLMSLFQDITCVYFTRIKDII